MTVFPCLAIFDDQLIYFVFGVHIDSSCRLIHHKYLRTAFQPFSKNNFLLVPPERFEIISFGPIHFVRIVLISSAVAFSIFESERAIPDLYCFKFAIVVLNVRSPFKIIRLPYVPP